MCLHCVLVFGVCLNMPLRSFAGTLFGVRLEMSLSSSSDELVGISPFV